MKTRFRALAAFALLFPILSQAADAGSCHYVPLAKLAVASSEGRMPTVAGSVNDRPVSMLVDTGAFQSMLMRPGAERLDLRLTPTGGFAYGAGAVSLSYVAHVRDFSVGATHTGKMQVPVLGDLAFKPDFDAIVGADYLLQADMELALADHYLQLFRASGCADTDLAYWDADAVEVPLLGTVENSNTPLVAVELNGVTLRAIVDTGALHTTVTRHAAELAGANLDAPGVRKGEPVAGVADRTRATWIVDFKRFRIGDETVRNPQMIVSEDQPAAPGQADVVLGDDFLRAHRVLFAMSQNRLYLSYLGSELFGAHPSAPQVAPKAP